METAIKIPRSVAAKLLDYARREPRIECCGLLAGRRAGSIEEVLPAHNSRNSFTAYEIAPQELFRLFREMRDRGLELAGIYHSHPKGDNAPSATDIELAYYPDVPYFILSPMDGIARPIRAFLIRDAATIELDVAVVED